MPKAGRAALAEIVRQARDPQLMLLTPAEIAERVWPAFRVAVTGVLNDLHAEELGDRDGNRPAPRKKSHATK